MTAQQIAEATLQAAHDQTILLLCQTILGIIAIVLAAREVRKWRTEVLGGKKIEVALRLGKAALAARDECVKVAKSEITISFPSYLKTIAEKLNVLNEIKWEVQILFDESDLIMRKIDRYTEQSKQLEQAIQTSYDKSQNKFVPIDSELFIEQFTTITNELMELIKKYSR